MCNQILDCENINTLKAPTESTFFTHWGSCYDFLLIWSYVKNDQSRLQSFVKSEAITYWIRWTNFRRHLLYSPKQPNSTQTAFKNIPSLNRWCQTLRQSPNIQNARKHRFSQYSEVLFHRKFSKIDSITTSQQQRWTIFQDHFTFEDTKSHVQPWKKIAQTSL